MHAQLDVTLCISWSSSGVMGALLSRSGLETTVRPRCVYRFTNNLPMGSTTYTANPASLPNDRRRRGGATILGPFDALRRLPAESNAAARLFCSTFMSPPPFISSHPTNLARSTCRRRLDCACCHCRAPHLGFNDYRFQFQVFPSTPIPHSTLPHLPLPAAPAICWPQARWSFRRCKTRQWTF